MTNQTALVTGASSGLGRAIALRLARRGFRVFAGVRSAGDAAEMAGLDAAISPVMLDVGSDAQIHDAAREVDRACGDAGLAVLVNAAGYATYTPVEYADAGEVSRLFDVVAFAPYRLANAMLPALRRAASAGHRARVVNIVSWAALDASPFVGFYAAAKAACLRLGQAQAFELDRFGIDVVSVLPGMMRTRFVKSAASQVTAAIERLPAAGRAAYGASLQHMADMSLTAPRNRLVPDPDAIAAKIVGIVAKVRVRHQYLLGFDTRLITFINRWLPFRLQRAIKSGLYGLNARAREQLPAATA